MIRFFNTLTGKLEKFISLQPGEVKLYTCGPTVYDYAHIGNYRAYVFEDLLKRFLVYMGYRVTHVMNITDVDDKIIKAAKEKGCGLNEYTGKYIKAFFDDIDMLNIARADIYPKATEHIQDMIRIIKKLLERGYAYKKDGSIYYDITKFPDYGKLSKINLSELRPGQRNESDEYEKESIHDFALWKQKKEGEFYWETDLGEGRPGWHIECSAMSSKYLGDHFDIHCGGVDNIFPHHENEIAQSEAYSGKKFVNYWLHCQYLINNGEKMSKSKGNQYILKFLLEKGYSPLSVRFLLLSTHYRKTLNFTFDNLKQADISLKRLSDFVYELENHSFEEGENSGIKDLIEGTENKFREGLSNDLNISTALTALFELIRKINTYINKGNMYATDSKRLLDTIDRFNQVLAVLPDRKIPELSNEIKEKIEEREKARQARDFKTADRIRDELLAQGILLEDTRDGIRWKIIDNKK
ncbi:MAG: cysteine--tRNA ligase [Candidatus Aminicenantes bacterium]|nr:cysteine--tRNA ligase [Candidatus Aminicenantes bacterium]